MSHKISPQELKNTLSDVQLLDVRKEPARTASGFFIAGARYFAPFDAQNRVSTLKLHPTVIYCVHGHEVSQAVCGFLRDSGIDARYLEGGIEDWIAKGFPVEAIESN